MRNIDLNGKNFMGVLQIYLLTKWLKRRVEFSSSDVI